MKKIMSVVGARPNFMKIAPINIEFQKYKDKVEHLICHTGQHYDANMSKVFFDELGLPTPDYYLGVGSGSHAIQTATIMMKFEEVLIKESPDLVIVVGDVNSTIACSLVAKKLNIKVAHIEAGLRSFDNSMPEEINRILTDAISDYLFVTEQSGLNNLKNEGVKDDKIFFVGNVMIDSLINNLNKINQSKILDRFSLKRHQYILCTLHRPANVDNRVWLKEIIELLTKYGSQFKILFPVHPRTLSNIESYGIKSKISNHLILCEPIGYIDFISLVKNSTLVITDSGGIQEEATFLNIQCLTLRENTERPVTIEIGTNQLIGTDINKIDKAVNKVLSGDIKKGKVPKYWDGKSAERICKILVEKLN